MGMFEKWEIEQLEYILSKIIKSLQVFRANTIKIKEKLFKTKIYQMFLHFPCGNALD